MTSSPTQPSNAEAESRPCSSIKSVPRVEFKIIDPESVVVMSRRYGI